MAQSLPPLSSRGGQETVFTGHLPALLNLPMSLLLNECWMAALARSTHGGGGRLSRAAADAGRTRSSSGEGSRNY